MNNQLQIGVIDQPAENGASHAYLIVGADMRKNPSFEVIDVAAKTVPGDAYMLIFQQGDPAEVGLNGLTHEVLLAALSDRLNALSKGPDACKEFAQALKHVDFAANHLNNMAIRKAKESAKLIA